MKAVYSSKRDLWIIVLVWAGMLLAAFGAALHFMSDAPLTRRVLVLVASVGIVGFVLSLLHSISYTIGDTDLLVCCGPFRQRIPLAEIDLVRPSRNPLSSPAASLDRLLIKWRDGRKRILISPEGKMDFMQELQNRCAHLARVGDELVRISSSR